MKHKYGNSVARLQCARGDKIIVRITMHIQKIPIHKLSRSKTLKHSKFTLTDIKEKHVDIFMVPRRH